MALSDKKIIEELKKGHIIIEPFNKENLSTSSYDVSLGEWYFSERSSSVTKIYNPFNKKETDRVWGTSPQKAKPAVDLLGEDFDFTGIAKDDLIILLEPSETILAHTNEFIGGKEHLTTMMKARSSMGRNFIEVCKCAGWGDVGYVNRWAMEITNNSRTHTIPLVVGRRIAQIIFFETGEILEGDYTYKGKYQTDSEVEKLKTEWDPRAILPRLYEDRDIK